MGYEENNTQEEKVTIYDAKWLTEADVLEMCRDHTSWFFEAHPPVKNAYNAVCYDDAEKALMAIVQNACNSKCHTFVRKNSWLGNKGDRKTFMESSTKQTLKDKEAVCYMWDIVNSASNYTNEVLNYFRDIVAGDAFRNSFMALRFDEMLKSLVQPHDYGDIDTMFNDFYKIYKYADSVKIYQQLNIHKSEMSVEEILKKLTDYFNNQLRYHPGLGMYMPTIDYMSPEYINKWRAIDRITCNYWILADTKPEIVKALNKVRELDARFDQEIGVGNIAAAGYGNGYQPIFFYLEKIFVKALEIIDNVPNLSTEAYKIFRYAVSLRECVTELGFGELNDPLKKGSKYSEYIAKMPKILTRFVTNMAKFAPQ